MPRYAFRFSGVISLNAPTDFDAEVGRGHVMTYLTSDVNRAMAADTELAACIEDLVVGTPHEAVRDANGSIVLPDEGHGV